MPSSNIPVRASRLPISGSKLPTRPVNDENAGRIAPVVKHSASPRRPLGNVTNASTLAAPKPVVEPAAPKASSVYTCDGLLSARNTRQHAQRLYGPKETFLQAIHSSIDDLDSDDECEDLLSVSIDAPTDDEILVPTPSIRLLAPTDSVTDRFESTVRYHAIINEKAAKKANTPIWLPTGFLTAPQVLPDVNPLPNHGSLDEATQAAQEDDEVELLLDINMDTAPKDGYLLVETPSIAVISPQEKVVDEFRSEIRHQWVTGAIPKHIMRFGPFWTPSGFLNADNARPELQSPSYADNLHEQTRSRHDKSYFAQAAFIRPREDDIDVGVPDVRIVDNAGKILDELQVGTAFFWVAPDGSCSSAAKKVPTPSRETVHKWFAERRAEVDVQPPFGYESKPVPAPVRTKLPPYPYGRGWSRKDIEANERIVHGEVRFPELLPPSDEPEVDESTHTYVPWDWIPAPKLAVAEMKRKGIAMELIKKEKKALRKAAKAPAPEPVHTVPSALNQPPASRLRAPVLKSRMSRPASLPVPAAPIAVPASPKKRAIGRPSALPQPASSHSILIPAASAPVAKPHSSPPRTSRLPVLQTRPAVPGRVQGTHCYTPATDHILANRGPMEPIRPENA